MPKGRKENGSGTIGYFPGRSKPYRVQVTVNGQRKSGGYYATMDEASKALRKLTVDIDEHRYIESNNITVAEWLKIWLDEYCVDIKESTRIMYASYIRNHIAPGIGRVKLKALQPHHVQTLINHLTRAAHGSKPLSPKTVKNIHGCLSAALAQAVQSRYIRENPATGCKLPRRDDEASVEGIRPFDEKEIRILLSAIRESRFESVILIGLYTGLRLSEILGLQWERVNLKSGEIVIDRQLTMLRKKGDTRRIAPTKTRNKRTIIAPAAVLDIIQRQKDAQSQWNKENGDVWRNPDHLVFTDEVGNSLAHASVEHEFKRILSREGLEHHVFHDLRHTFAVEMLRAGTDIETIAKLLGHYDPGFTLRVYADSTPDMRRAAADRLQALIESRQE